MIKVEIDRARWYRGQGSEESQLQREDGMRCCLGFAALACGYTEKQITGTLTPSELIDNLGLENEWPVGVISVHTAECSCGAESEDSKVIQSLMILNDNDGTDQVLVDGVWFFLKDESERERLLTEQAAKVGMEFVFVGESIQ